MVTLTKIKDVLKWGFRILAVTLNNLYCIPTYVIWCLLLHPLYLVNPELYWMIEGQFFQWLLTMVAYWSYSAGYYIVETGDVIDTLINDETLILANHQSTSDVPLLMHAFSTRNGLLQKLNWIMDAVFQYTNFGVVSTLHGDFFINAGRDRRDASLRDLENYLKHTFLPRKRKWLVLFPEGGFLRKRKEASKRYAEKMNLPNLEYVTLPRLGALQTIINTLVPDSSTTAELNSKDGLVRADESNKGRLKYIVDMTIAYPDGEPLDLGTIITGYVPSCKIHMHYKVYHVSEVPHSNPDELQSWLYNLYIEKNNLLGHYYKRKVWDPEMSKVSLGVTFHEIPSEEPRNTKKRNKYRNQTKTDANESSNTPNNISPNSSGQSDLESEPEYVETINFSDSESMFEPMEDIDFPELEERRIEEARFVHLDLLRVTFIHVMFFTSTLLHCTAIRIIYQYMFGGTA